MTTLKNKTIVITGASRGIGRAIALKCAADGANIVIAAKTTEPHPKLQGTIYTVAKEVEEVGGVAMPMAIDVREAEQLEYLASEVGKRFGGVDIVVNNAGAIRLTTTDATPAKSFDLMMQINVRATFLCSRAFLPYLEKSSHAHILNLSPPISLDPKWLQNNVAYTMTKYGMSLCTIGMAAEFKDRAIAVNSLWPKTAIATAAITMLMGEKAFEHCRKPEIMADAAYALFRLPPHELTGQCLLDEDFLRTQGISDFEHYSCVPGAELVPDFYV